ncbi:MAG: SMC family ATPase, partial [Oscillospiraceae bacterium]|nr:SMC family ATPase [Oscillospiraceae bacterium]
FVELDFISGESRYNIKRTIKKTGQDVSLILPDGSSMSGDRNIKPKIIEIIGLDRDQFAQIVMIAQNDFLRFLQSNTDERVKILRRIFGTESLRQFQERLKSLVKRESDNRALILHDFERFDVDVYRRDDIFKQWEGKIITDKLDITDINKRLLVYDNQKQELAAALAVAEELLMKFSDLSKCRQLLGEFKARADEIDKAKIRAARGEVSLYKVKPLYENLQKGIINHTAAQTELKNAQEQKTAADTELAEADKNIETLPSLDDAQTAYNALMKEWEVATQKLKQLLALEVTQKEIDDKCILLSKRKEELIAVQDVLSKLPLVNDRREELDKISKELRSNEERLVALLSLQKDFDAIVHKQAELEKEQSEFEKLNAQFMDNDENYRVLEEAFLRGQAGVIASSLTDGEPCPVCGSTEHPIPASITDDDVSEAKLKKAKEAKDKAGEKRETKASICGALQTEVATLSKRFVADASILILDITIQTATASLLENINKTQSAIKAGGATKTNAEKSLAELIDRFEKSTSRRDELTPSIASLQSEIDTLSKRFISDFSVYIPSVTWESSKLELNELRSQTQKVTDDLTTQKATDKEALDLLASSWDAGYKRKANAESTTQSAATRVSERTVSEQKLLRLRNEAQTEYEAALAYNEILSEADYKAALITENELATLKKQISDYEKGYEQLTRDIGRLENETANKEPPDIERLRTESEIANSESKLLGEKRDEINGQLRKTENALKELRHVAAEFEKSEKTYAAVKQLADTANGKLDFETYAQMAYFERVLRAANLRLRIMSQNRYTLLRKTESDDGRKRSGLEMEVMDAYTGKARSANSLSGGESFMASLSLALGLSDVVQQSAGGIRLDAMFIDEGFGTLDVDVLELAIRTLSEMAGVNRIIGIISHVSELRERIDRQIQVEKTFAGSKIYVTPSKVRNNAK